MKRKNEMTNDVIGWSIWSLSSKNTPKVKSYWKEEGYTEETVQDKAAKLGATPNAVVITELHETPNGSYETVIDRIKTDDLL